MKHLVFLCIILSSVLFACKQEAQKPLLPYYGPSEAGPDGEGDTIYFSVPSFSFVNQEGNIVNDKTYEGKIYVTDFFFVRCKSICPKMSSQLQRVQEHFKNDNEVMILSHTVDPENDSIEALARYAEELKADPKKWNFVTGGKKELYDMARNGYYLGVEEGDGGPDDFIHSDRMILVDTEKHIRGIYDGTSTADVDRLVHDIGLLKEEMGRKKEK